MKRLDSWQTHSDASRIPSSNVHSSRIKARDDCRLTFTLIWGVFMALADIRTRGFVSDHDDIISLFKANARTGTSATIERVPESHGTSDSHNILCSNINKLTRNKKRAIRNNVLYRKRDK